MTCLTSSVLCTRKQYQQRRSLHHLLSMLHRWLPLTTLCLQRVMCLSLPTQGTWHKLWRGTAGFWGTARPLVLIGSELWNTAPFIFTSIFLLGCWLPSAPAVNQGSLEVWVFLTCNLFMVTTMQGELVDHYNCKYQASLHVSTDVLFACLRLACKFPWLFSYFWRRDQKY